MDKTDYEIAPTKPHDLSHLTYINNTLFGIPIQQTWSALFMLEQFITEQKFMFIFELGSGAGALTKFFTLHKEYTWGFDIISGDDVFGGEVKSKVWFFASRGKTLVFCDDGDKPREIREYAPMLKKGDFILGHDWRRPDGIPESFLEELPKLGLETYRQNEWDEMVTYILCLRKIS